MVPLVASITLTDSEGSIIRCVFCIRLSEVGKAIFNMFPESLGKIGIPVDPLLIVTTFLSFTCKSKIMEIKVVVMNGVWDLSISKYISR